MSNNLVVGRMFFAKDYALALKHKEASGGILVRLVLPSGSVMYEVRYLPPYASEG